MSRPPTRRPIGDARPDIRASFSGRRQARTSLLVAALALCAMPSAGRAGWEIKPDPPAEPFTISAKPGQAIPLPNPGGMWPEYPTTHSPFVSVGQSSGDNDTREVWDLRTFTKAGAIKGKLGASFPALRISPDGKHLAIVVADSDKERAIEIWSFVDGRRVSRVEPEPRPKKIMNFDFASKGRLVVAVEREKGKEKSKSFQTYDLATGKGSGKDQALPENYQDGTFALSPGRKLFAFVANKEVHVVDLETGKEAGRVSYNGNGGNALAFSPDGTELAGLFDLSPGVRLTVWDLAKGEVAVDHVLMNGSDFPTPGWMDSSGRSIDWLPDGSAWLLGGHALINRKDGRWVWSLFAPANKDPKTGQFLPNAFFYTQSVRLLDNDHVLGGVRGRTQGGRLEAATIPWPLIDASLKAVEANTPALLGPGGSLTLKVEVAAARGVTAKEAQDALIEAITESLAAEAIKVADRQPVALYVKHNEEPGPPYRIVGPGLRSTGASVLATKFTTELSLWVSGKNAPVWSSQKTETGLGHFTTDRETGGRVDEVGMRMGGFEKVKKSLMRLGLPYFIPRPKEKNLAMLPGTTILAPSPLSARFNANATSKAKVDKPTMRGKAAGAGKKP